MAYRIIIIVLCFLSLDVYSQDMTRKAYIEKYNKLAVSQMKKNGIPASIILAQAVLESQNGNSELARKSNNHFGIKCHSSWKGDRVFHDDDKEQECFRKYKKVEDSFYDHSLFLKGNRYQFLYDIPIRKYKAWAKGLKKAGYATNPKYPELLISIIESNELTRFDSKISKYIEDSIIFVNGFSYGWPYVLTQHFMYLNYPKEFYLQSNLQVSFSDLSVQIGGGKLLTNNIGVGANFGFSFNEFEDEILNEPIFGIETKFLIPTKNKIVVINLFLNSNKNFELRPSFSIGLLN